MRFTRELQPGFRPAPPRQTETDETYTPAEKAKYVKSDITIKVNQGKSNTVNLNQAAVSVGVVSTPTFDARKLVTKSVRFGPAGAAPVSRQDSDFNGDGLIDAVFAFTYVPDFFGKMGFAEVERGELPLKAWKDCLRCPKFQCCDEVAMYFALR